MQISFILLTFVLKNCRLFIACKIGKQCKPVQVHPFSRFSLWVNLRKLLVGEASPIPFEQYLRYWLLVHSERLINLLSVKTKKNATTATLIFRVTAVASLSANIFLLLFLFFLFVDIQNRFNCLFGNQQFFSFFSHLTILRIIFLLLYCQTMKFFIQ